MSVNAWQSKDQHRNALAGRQVSEMGGSGAGLSGGSGAGTRHLHDLP